MAQTQIKTNWPKPKDKNEIKPWAKSKQNHIQLKLLISLTIWCTSFIILIIAYSFL